MKWQTREKAGGWMLAILWFAFIILALPHIHVSLY